MKTLTRANLVEKLCSHFGFTRIQVEDIIENFFEIIVASLEQGQSVHLSGFGNFILRNKKNRPGRNPKTGQPVDILERRVVTFKAGNRLKGHIERSALLAKDQEMTAETSVV